MANCEPKDEEGRKRKKETGEGGFPRLGPPLAGPAEKEREEFQHRDQLRMSKLSHARSAPQWL